MAETLLSCRTLARLYAVDTDTTDPALSNSEWNSLINTAYLDYARMYPEQFSTSATSPMAAVTLTQGEYVYDVTTAAGVIEFTGAVNMSSATDAVGPLDRSDFTELYWLSFKEGAASGTYPSRWGVRRINDTLHQFVVYPAPGAPATNKQVYVFGYKEPAQLSSDSSTFAGIADSEVKWIARLAAIRGAGVIGRSQEFVDRLWSDLPEKMRLSWRKHESFKRPYSKPSEVVT